MYRVSTLLAFVLAIGGAALPARTAVAQADLSDTYWEADGDCFIVDLAFYSDGTVDIDFDNGDDDTGTWALSGPSVRIEFDAFDDDFLGNYSGNAIKAAHIWNTKEDDAPQTESCVFRRVGGDRDKDKVSPPPV